MQPGTLKLLWITGTVIIGVGTTMVADVLLKQHALMEDWRYLLSGAVLYGAVAFPVAYALRLTSFGGLFLIWESATVVAGVTIASLLYHEPLTVQRMLAVILVIAAILLAAD